MYERVKSFLKYCTNILLEIGLVIKSESNELSELFTVSPLRVNLTGEWILPSSEVTIMYDCD